ncbi:hypothetical protein C8Q76DRAFT_822715 [Earliella scabrosa]|nr:hypothetical protein C8Q76DRAFT_822715 [Earliella scabrosa]
MSSSTSNLLVTEVEALLLGAMIASMIYGLTLLQTFSFFRSREQSNTKCYLRIFVTALFVFDSLHQALVIHITYTYVTMALRDPLASTLLWCVPSLIIVANRSASAILKFMFDGFLTYRLFRLNTNKYIVAFSALLSLADFVIPCGRSGSRFQFSSIVVSQAVLRNNIYVELSISTFASLFLSVCLGHKLYNMRTGLQSFFNLLDLIMPTLTIVTLVYANALLSSLNVREYFRGVSDGNCTTVTNTIHLSQFNTSHRINLDQPDPPALDTDTSATKDQGPDIAVGSRESPSPSQIVDTV